MPFSIITSAILLIYVSCVGMCNSCLQLQLWGHRGSFAYFLFFKKNQSRTQASHIYNFNIFYSPNLTPPSPEPKLVMSFSTMNSVQYVLEFLSTIEVYKIFPPPSFPFHHSSLSLFYKGESASRMYLHAQGQVHVIFGKKYYMYPVK